MDEKVKEIMEMWDSWRAYIANGGTASWPRDAFENFIGWYEEGIEEKEKERERLSKLLIEARMRIVELREKISLLIDFIPNEWEVPLGWTIIVSQARKLIKKKD